MHNKCITNAQMHKCTNAQMHKCTNGQMHLCTNAFWIRLNCIPTTIELHSDYDWTAFWLQLNCILTTMELHSEYNWIAFWLRLHWIWTACSSTSSLCTTAPPRKSRSTATPFAPPATGLGRPVPRTSPLALSVADLAWWSKCSALARWSNRFVGLVFVCLFGFCLFAWFVCLLVCLFACFVEFVCLVCLFVCLFVCFVCLVASFVCFLFACFVCLLACLFG